MATAAHATLGSLQFTPPSRQTLVWLAQVGKGELSLVGGKAAGLGELSRIGMKVPPGFVVTTAAYRAHLRAHRLDGWIERQLRSVTTLDSKQLHQISDRIQARLAELSLDPSLTNAITEAYQDLVARPDGGSLVAVRSSAVAEGLPDASVMTHQHATFLGLSGSARILAAIQRAWASLFTPEALHYRLAHGIEEGEVALAVIVQSLIEADAAGVLTTLDPTAGDKSVIQIEAIAGLGEPVTSGTLTPDRYVVDKATLAIKARTISRQTWQLGRRAGSSQPVHLPIPLDHQEQPKLTDERIVELARLANQIEAHEQFPQTIEWALRGETIFILETKPIAVVRRSVKVRGSLEPAAPPTARPLLSGDGVSLGVASGPVRILHRADEADRIGEGDILVAETISPELMPAIRRAAGVITDAGGRTSHAAIVTRELGIPAVIGTGTATHLLHEGQTVTVDGTLGRVYRGQIQNPESRIQNDQRRTSRGHQVRTATKVMVNLSVPERAYEVAKLDVDGVGMLRAEFMLASLGTHPQALITAGRREELVSRLAAGIERFTRAFHPHPVIYRSADFKTNEYRSLLGGAELEPAEENPMLGRRGLLRALADPAIFTAELEAVKRVRARANDDNLWLMLPFVRTVAELRAAKALVQTSGLLAERRFKLYMMCEVPSNVLLIEDFLDEGIDGISIGSNDLTQLILGIDRDNQALAASFDERDPAVLKAIELVLSAARARHVPVSICGEAPSKYPELVELLVRHGVSAISVAPSAVDQTRRLIASVEHRLHHASLTESLS